MNIATLILLPLLAGGIQFVFFHDRNCPRKVQWALPSLLLACMALVMMIPHSSAHWLLIGSIYVLAGALAGSFLGRITRR